MILAQSDHVHQLDDDKADIVVLFLDVLCATCTPEETQESRHRIHAMARYLTEREVAAMVLGLVASPHHTMVDRALRLAVLVLHADAHSPDAAVSQRHSETFELALHTSAGRRALAAFRGVFEAHKQRLQKRQHELLEDAEDRDAAEEMLDVDIVRAVLQLVEQLCLNSNIKLQVLPGTCHGSRRWCSLYFYINTYVHVFKYSVHSFQRFVTLADAFPPSGE